MPKRVTDDRTFPLRMPERVYQRVSELATERDRSATWVMNRLLDRIFREHPDWIEETLGQRLVAASRKEA